MQDVPDHSGLRLGLFLSHGSPSHMIVALRVFVVLVVVGSSTLGTAAKQLLQAARDLMVARC